MVGCRIAPTFSAELRVRAGVRGDGDWRARELCKPLYVVSSCHQRMPRSSRSRRRSDLLRKPNFMSTLCM